MKTLSEQLSRYAEYHRHPKNIATHFVGIPLIVAAVTVLLSRVSVDVGGWAVSAALVCAAAVLAYYVVLDIFLGALMAAMLGLCLWLGTWTAAQPLALWAAIGVGGFIAGWALQFLGHHHEGRKPAFVDDLMGLVIGPLFVLTEALFLLGVRRDLKREIEERAGPTRAWSFVAR